MATQLQFGQELYQNVRRGLNMSVEIRECIVGVRQPLGPARESSHVLPMSSACLGLARFHLHQLSCFPNREFITDSTHFHVPTLVPLISWDDY
jgi:hypothetical protein